MKYRVFCWFHHYDTLKTIDHVATAVSAARMHAMLPCNRVEVEDENGKKIEWREEVNA